MSEELKVPTCFECGDVLEEGRLFCCLECEQKLMSEDEV